MKQTTCPRLDQVRLYLAATLSPTEIGPLEEHLDSCPSCAERLRESLVADPLFRLVRESRLRDAATDTPLGMPDRIASLCGPSQEGRTTIIGDDQVTTGLPDVGPSTAGTDLAGLLHPPQRADEIGRLGGYRVLRVLGRGGMGVVCLAEDERLGRPAALKLMRPGLPAEAEYGRRFLHEGRALAALTHPHVVTIYQMGEDKGVAFLAMESLQGESLQERLKANSSPSLGEVLRIVREMAVGLAYAHAQGVVHRDVKPANVFLVGEGRQVKLLDFGLAREGAGSGETRPGQIVGTPEYMAPEQAQGDAVDARADLFGLGCVLYHLLTNRLPFGNGDVLKVLAAVARDEAVPVQRFHPWLPARLATLVRRLLAKTPQERPATADEVVAEIEAIEAEAAKNGSSEREVGEARSAAGGRSRRRVWMCVLGVSMLSCMMAAVLMLVPSTDKVEKGKGKERANNGSDQDKDKKKDKEKAKPSTGAWKLDPVALPKAGTPLGPKALTREPVKLKGLTGSWGLETKGHRGAVLAVAYNADGSLLAVSSKDGTIRLYDTKTWEMKHALVGEVTHHLAWAPDGKRLLAQTAASKCFAWELSAGKRLGQLALAPYEREIICAISPDGQKVAGLFGSKENRMLLYDLTTGKLELKAKLPMQSVSWHRNGKLVVAQGQRVLTYNLEKKAAPQDLNLDKGTISAARYSPDGKHLFVHVAKTAGFVLTDGYEAAFQTEMGHWSPDSSFLAHYQSVHTGTGWSGRLHLWDMKTDKSREIKKLPAGAYAWSPDGKHLAIAAPDQDGDGAVTVIDVKGKEIHTIRCLPDRQVIRNLAGHYKPTKAVAGEVIDVVETAEGQKTLTPAEFEKQYGWKNDPKELD